jgi:aminopeptidase
MTPTEFAHYLEQYAEVIIRVGLNLQPGQRLLIGASLSGRSGAPLESAPLVRLVTEKAYQAGAPFVDVIWDDEHLKRLRFEHAPRDSFEHYSTWKTETTAAYGERGDALLVLQAADPDLLAGQDPELIATAQRVDAQHCQPMAAILGQVATTWLIMSVPVPGWSAKVLPDIPAAEREGRMWEIIFEMCRARGDDPVRGWQEHLRGLTTRSDYLNGKHYSALKYTAPGTDLTVGLPDRHLWRSPMLTNSAGITFTPNLPTEEIFSIPHKDRVEGVVSATKPLSSGGTLIEGFTLTFEAGQVVRATADKGEAALRSLLDTDENARRLGEVALVPNSSPISQSGLLFYHNLFDENASNHIALGRAFKFSMAGSESLSDDEFEAEGGNRSLIHVDFMIGSGEMDVDGITEDGAVESVMRAGEWAFEVS